MRLDVTVVFTGRALASKEKADKGNRDNNY
jgi:hypothetical protein